MGCLKLIANGCARSARCVSPRPTAKHAVATTKLSTKLDGSFGTNDGSGRGGWWILIEPEIHVHDCVLVPDLAGWKRSRMATIPDVDYFETIPD